MLRLKDGTTVWSTPSPPFPAFTTGGAIVSSALRSHRRPRSHRRLDRCTATQPLCRVLVEHFASIRACCSLPQMSPRLDGWWLLSPSSLAPLSVAGRWTLPPLLPRALLALATSSVAGRWRLAHNRLVQVGPDDTIYVTSNVYANANQANQSSGSFIPTGGMGVVSACALLPARTLATRSNHVTRSRARTSPPARTSLPTGGLQNRRSASDDRICRPLP
eukprot:4482880-Prymnesium_polylepis.1